MDNNMKKPERKITIRKETYDNYGTIHEPLILVRDVLRGLGASDLLSRMVSGGNNYDADISAENLVEFNVKRGGWPKKEYAVNIDGYFQIINAYSAFMVNKKEVARRRVESMGAISNLESVGDTVADIKEQALQLVEKVNGSGCRSSAFQ